MLAHRGALVPVIDLSALSFGRRRRARQHPPGAGALPRRPQRPLQLGLILEQATETLRCRPDEFQPYGLDNAEAPYLGPVRQDAQGCCSVSGRRPAAGRGAPAVVPQRAGQVPT
jgi:chemotaxis-related protein WspB